MKNKNISSSRFKRSANRINLKFSCAFVVSFLLIVSNVLAQEVYSDMVMFHITDSSGKTVTQNQLLNNEYKIKVCFNAGKPDHIDYAMDSLMHSIYLATSYSGNPIDPDYPRILIIHASDTMRVVIFADTMLIGWRHNRYYDYEHDSLKTSYEIKFQKGDFSVMDDNGKLSLDVGIKESYPFSAFKELSWSEGYWISVPAK